MNNVDGTARAIRASALIPAGGGSCGRPSSHAKNGRLATIHVAAATRMMGTHSAVIQPGRRDTAYLNTLGAPVRKWPVTSPTGPRTPADLHVNALAIPTKGSPRACPQR